MQVGPTDSQTISSLDFFFFLMEEDLSSVVGGGTDWTRLIYVPLCICAAAIYGVEALGE